jgi:hypothetical protein
MIKWSQDSTYMRLPMTLGSSNGKPLDLTGLSAAAITLKKRPAGEGTNYTDLVGTPTILNASKGQIYYKFDPTDVSVSGDYYLVVSVSFGLTDIWNSFEQEFVITQSR